MEFSSHIQIFVSFLCCFMCRMSLEVKQKAEKMEKKVFWVDWRGFPLRKERIPLFEAFKRKLTDIPICACFRSLPSMSFEVSMLVLCCSLWCVREFNNKFFFLHFFLLLFNFSPRTTNIFFSIFFYIPWQAHNTHDVVEIVENLGWKIHSHQVLPTFFHLFNII